MVQHCIEDLPGAVTANASGTSWPANHSAQPTSNSCSCIILIQANGISLQGFYDSQRQWRDLDCVSFVVTSTPSADSPPIAPRLARHLAHIALPRAAPAYLQVCLASGMPTLVHM